jgi:hypothetical protein
MGQRLQQQDQRQLQRMQTRQQQEGAVAAADWEHIATLLSVLSAYLGVQGKDELVQGLMRIKGVPQLPDCYAANCSKCNSCKESLEGNSILVYRLVRYVPHQYVVHNLASQAAGTFFILLPVSFTPALHGSLAPSFHRYDAITSWQKGSLTLGVFPRCRDGFLYWQLR